MHILLVDFKLSENGIAVLEFGDGANSDLTPLAGIQKKDASYAYQKILEALGQKFNRVLVITKGSGRIDDLIKVLNNNSSDNNKKYDYLSCFRYRGMGHAGFKELKELDRSEIEKFHQLTEKDCIVVMGEDSLECANYAVQLKTYCIEHDIKAAVVNSNPSVIALCENKLIYKCLDQKEHMPAELIGLKEVSQQYEDKLRRISSLSPYVVLKPTREAGASGVMVLPMNKALKVIEYLRFIFSSNCGGKQAKLKKLKALGLEKMMSNTFTQKGLNFWNNEHAEYHPAIIVQPFAASIKVDGYDPTGRAVFIVDDAGGVDLVAT